MKQHLEKFIPDVNVPLDDPHGLRNLLVREATDLRFVRERDGQENMREAGQILANVDKLLDNFPLGVLRNEISLDEARRRADGGAHLARFAVQALDGRAA